MQTPSEHIDRHEAIEPSKLAYVISGGGFNAGFAVGAVETLSKLGFAKPGIVVTSSASGPTGASLIADQMDECRETWINEISDPDLILRVNGSHVPRIQVNRIIGLARERINRLALLENTTQLHFMATDYDSGRPVALDANHAQDDEHFYEMMRASMAIPGAYGEVVEIGGRRFIDGDLSSSEAYKVAFARYQGARDVVVIRSTRPENLLEMTKILAVAPDHVKQIYRGNRKELFMPAQQDSHTLIISPTRKLLCGLMKSNRREDIDETMRQGEMDVINHSRIGDWIERFDN